MSVNPFAVLARYAKQAADPAMFQAQLASEARGDIGRMALAALGAGVAARGLTGLAGLARRHLSPIKPRYPSAIVAGVPYPVEEDKDTSIAKAAQAIPAATTNYTSRTSFPWYYGGMGAAGMLGAYAGWKGLDAVLAKRRGAEREGELSAAKSDFEQALLDSYTTPRPAEKTAGHELGEALDQLFDAVVEKRATLDDTIGKGLGYYGLYAALTGIPAAAIGYSKAVRGSQRSVLAKAMQQRIRRSYASRPSEVFAVPKPVRVPREDETSPAETQQQVTRAEAETPIEAADPGAFRPRRRIDTIPAGAALGA